MELDELLSQVEKEEEEKGEDIGSSPSIPDDVNPLSILHHNRDYGIAQINTSRKNWKIYLG